MSTRDEIASPSYKRDLGNGFVVRWSERRDAAAIAELCGYVFRSAAADPPNRSVMAWIGDAMSGRHPHTGPGDHAVVEEVSSGRIVSSAFLLSYEVDLEGAGVPFGRPEAVATHPDYRNRGFVRAIFELLHARSEARGHLIQGITGIRYYYRLFGYEYAADLGGQINVPFTSIPPLEPGKTEPYTLRGASASDLPLALELYERDCARYALTARISAEYWRWVAFGQDRASGEGWTTRMIVDAAGTTVGYAATATARHSDEIALHALNLREGTSLASVLPSLLRGLVAVSGEPLPRKQGLPAPSRVALGLGREHPVYRLLTEAQCQGVRRAPAYAWYLRVPDVPKLLLLMRDTLAARLAGSPVAGYTGELRLTFYPGGLRLLFAGGRLESVERWREDHAWGPRAQAGFPPHVFLKLVFGYRSLAELGESYPDVTANDEARPLLEALFPPRATMLKPLD